MVRSKSSPSIAALYHAPLRQRGGRASVVTRWYLHRRMNDLRNWNDGRSTATRAWLWVGLWGALVWWLGSEDLSMDNTSRFLGSLIQWLLPNISQVDNELVQFYLRKLAHVAEYAVLAVLMLRGLMAGLRSTFSRAALTSIGLATAFAVADEARQSLSASRSGSGWDVALDGIGAAAGVVLLLLLTQRLRGRMGLARSDRQMELPGTPKPVSAEDTHTGTSK